MKIRVNYDLVEQIVLANKGFSMKQYAKDVIESIITATAVCSPIFVLGGVPIRIVGDIFCSSIPICAILNGASNLILTKIEKEAAKETLNILSRQLNDIYFDTNSEMLMDAKVYKREYKLNFEKFPPKLEEHKYLMIPVNNAWGNSERSLHQEHVIGTKDYDLSYGEPEKEKVYSLGTKKAIK